MKEQASYECLNKNAINEYLKLITKQYYLVMLSRHEKNSIDFPIEKEFLKDTQLDLN